MNLQNESERKKTLTVSRTANDLEGWPDLLALEQKFRVAKKVTGGDENADLMKMAGYARNGAARAFAEQYGMVFSKLIEALNVVDDAELVGESEPELGDAESWRLVPAAVLGEIHAFLELSEHRGFSPEQASALRHRLAAGTNIADVVPSERRTSTQADTLRPVNLSLANNERLIDAALARLQFGGLEAEVGGAKKRALIIAANAYAQQHGLDEIDVFDEVSYLTRGQLEALKGEPDITQLTGWQTLVREHRSLAASPLSGTAYALAKHEQADRIFEFAAAHGLEYDVVRAWLDKAA